MIDLLKLLAKVDYKAVGLRPMTPGDMESVGATYTLDPTMANVQGTKMFLISDDGTTIYTISVDEELY